MRIRVIRPAAREFRPYLPYELEELIEEYRQFVSPSIDIEVVRVQRGTQTVETCYDVEMAAPFVLEEVLKAEQDGIDAVVIHCMADPGLTAAREIVRIPVFGEALACFATAITLGDRFSILAPVPGGDMVYKTMLRVYGLESHLASIRSINIPVAELSRDLAHLKQRMFEVATQTIEEDRAEVIVPGCGGMSGVCRELTLELGVPVIDPKETVFKYAEMMLALSLSHSKKTYPTPPEKRRQI
jgi:allantoin racemase